MKIIEDEKFLRQKSEPANLDEAKDIAEQLFLTLLERKENDVGLSAPQIGILKQVCAIRAKQSFILVNPRIVGTEGETWYQEGCLSFPGASVRTKRYKNIVVEADYIGTGNSVIQDKWRENVKLYFTSNDGVPIEDDKDLLECVAVQHEISHLDGNLMFDFEWKNEPVKEDKKVGRNDPCPCGKIDKNGKLIKYKKCCGKV